MVTVCGLSVSILHRSLVAALLVFGERAQVGFGRQKTQFIHFVV